MNLAQRIITEAKAMQSDQRYGSFTNPVMLGLLLAVDIVKREENA